MKTARTILEAALAALDDEAQTTAERMAKDSPRDTHNDPMRPKASEAKHGTNLARAIAARERYLDEEGLK
jgi:hypothetical protein